MCEAEERNTRAVYELEMMAGSWVFDIGRIRDILTGRNTTACTEHKEPPCAA